MASEITDVMNNSAISVKRRIVPPYILDAHVKTLKSLNTNSLESYCQGFILAGLNKSGFLPLHHIRINEIFGRL
jgi:hypothetical protein